MIEIHCTWYVENVKLFLSQQSHFDLVENIKNRNKNRTRASLLQSSEDGKQFFYVALQTLWICKQFVTVEVNVQSICFQMVHSTPNCLTFYIFYLSNALHTLSFSYIYIMHLKAIVSLIFIYTALYDRLFYFSYLLYTENIGISTEDEAESHFEHALQEVM